MREEPTRQYWRVPAHHNLGGDPGHCTSRGSLPPQIETHPLYQSNRSPYHHQRRVTSAQLESRPHAATREQPLEHHHLRGAFPHNAITQKPPSTTREETPETQLKRRGHTKISRLRHISKEYLCTSLPERKPPPQSERKNPLQL